MPGGGRRAGSRPQRQVASLYQSRDADDGAEPSVRRTRSRRARTREEPPPRTPPGDEDDDHQRGGEDDDHQRGGEDDDHQQGGEDDDHQQGGEDDGETTGGGGSSSSGTRKVYLRGPSRLQAMPLPHQRPVIRPNGNKYVTMYICTISSYDIFKLKPHTSNYS